MSLFKARHRRRAKFGFWSGLRFIGFISTLLLLIGIGLQILVPREWVQWQAEEHLTEQLALPVTLPGASLGMFPLPHVRSDQVQVGGAERPLLRGEGLRLFLDPGGLFRGQPFQRVDLERLSLGPQALLTVAAGSDAVGDFGLNSLQAARVGLVAPDELDGNAPSLRLNRLPGERWLLELIRGDETLSVNAQRAGRWIRAELRAAAWTLEGEPELRFESLSTVARIQDGKVELEPFSAEFAQGTVRASLALERGDDWRLQGSLTLQQLPSGPLLERLGRPLLRGRADGTLYLTANAPGIESLAAELGVDGEVDLTDGELIGIDLQQPAVHRGIGEFSGGRTPFKELHLSVQASAGGQDVELRGLRSDALQAAGQVRIGGGRLQGSAQVRLSSRGGTDVPLLLSGTPRSPLLRVDPEAVHANAWHEPDQGPVDNGAVEDDGEPWILNYQ